MYSRIDRGKDMGYAEINGHKMHIYKTGGRNKPKLVFMSGSGSIDCPVLMFVSDGKQVSAHWIENAKKFAKQLNAKTVFLNCGHYIHHYESERISREIRAFINQTVS